MVRLVYAESTSDVRAAIRREKQIKGWLRAKKIRLIESLKSTRLGDTWGEILRCAQDDIPHSRAGPRAQDDNPRAQDDTPARSSRSIRSRYASSFSF